MSVSLPKRMITAGVACAELAVPFSAPQMTSRGPESFAVQVFDPTKPLNLDVSLLDDGQSPEFFTPDQMKGQLEATGNALRLSTEGRLSIGSTAIRRVHLEPLGRKNDTPCYTDRQISELWTGPQTTRKTGQAALHVVAINTGSSCNEGYIGAASTDLRHPGVVLNLKKGGWSVHVIAHELGHEEGLGHQGEYNCRVWRKRDGALVRSYMIGTAEQWVAAECGLARGSNKIDEDEYASTLSVMGNARDLPNTELLTPPELAKIGQVKTQEIDSVPGKYYLSYEKGKTFGARLKLPEDSALRKQIPGAESLYFGPELSGPIDEQTISLSEQKLSPAIRAFVETSPSRGNKTVALNTNPDSDGYKVELPSVRTNQVGLLYMDEKNIFIGGTDTKGTYLEVLDRNSLGAQIVIAAKSVSKRHSDQRLHKRLAPTPVGLQFQ